jgi:hypothetical protein
MNLFDKLFLVVVWLCGLTIIGTLLYSWYLHIKANRKTTTKPTPILHTLCQKCSPDGDYFTAVMGRFPVGAKMRCNNCGKVFGKIPVDKLTIPN